VLRLRNVRPFAIAGAVATVLWSLSGGGEPRTNGGAPAPAMAVTKVAHQLYSQRCQRCHEADGKGNGTNVPDFTSVRWQRSRSDHQFLVSILDGKKTMPGFRGKISDEQARELVALVRTFANGGPSQPDFAGRFRELEDELAKLQKQFQNLSKTNSNGPDKP
jgi:mono/diheme cytochrome c family protein